MTVEVLLMQVFNGLSLGSILLLVGLGLGITFGIMGVINFAHGEFLMIGAYMTYLTQIVFSHYVRPELMGLYFAAALPVSFLGAALIPTSGRLEVDK